MGSLLKEPAFLDFGVAPELFASGLHDVEIMGSVCRFVMYVERNHNGEVTRQAPFTCIMPLDAIGPAIGLVIRRLGSRILIPTIARHVLM